MGLEAKCKQCGEPVPLQDVIKSFEKLIANTGVVELNCSHCGCKSFKLMVPKEYLKGSK